MTTLIKVLLTSCIVLPLVLIYCFCLCVMLAVVMITDLLKYD